MMKKLMLAVLAAVAAHGSTAQATAREEARLIEASGVLEELFTQRDTAIPERLMARAYGIAVIPNVVKVAAVVGGRRGSGAMVVRDANGKFSDPIMVSLTGGNVGWQIGVQSTDIVLVFTTAKSIQAINTKSNKGLYGKSAPASDIIERKVSTDADSARRFERAILASTAGHAPAAATANSTPAATQPAPKPAPTAGMQDPAAAASAGSSSLPIEDAQPGA